MLVPANIIPYVGLQPKRHKYYKDSVDMYNDLLVHSDGIYPKKLLDIARPNEDVMYKRYRESVSTVK